MGITAAGWCEGPDRRSTKAAKTKPRLGPLPTWLLRNQLLRQSRTNRQVSSSLVERYDRVLYVLELLRIFLLTILLLFAIVI